MRGDDDMSASVEELGDYATRGLPPQGYNDAGSADEMTGYVQQDFDRYARKMRSRHRAKVDAILDENKSMMKTAKERLEHTLPDDLTLSSDSEENPEKHVHDAALTIQCAYRQYRARVVYCELLYAQYDAEYTSQRQLDWDRAEEATALTSIAQIEHDNQLSSEKRQAYQRHQSAAASLIQQWWKRIAPSSLHARIRFLRKRIVEVNADLVADLERREQLQTDIDVKQGMIAQLLQAISQSAGRKGKKK